MKAKYARCTYCGLIWNIDIEKVIPRSGYECPRCKRKRKKALRRSQLRGAHNK